MEKEKNPMNRMKIEKVVLSVGETGDELEKAAKLLKIISNIKPVKTKSNKRIPSFGVRPGMEVGAKVTLRNKKDIELILKRLFASVDNTIKEKQIKENHFSFGIHEYIEIPGMEYQRDIGMRGLNVTVDSVKPGRRVMLRKMKKGRFPRRQWVTKEEIINFLKEKFNLIIIPKKGGKK